MILVGYCGYDGSYQGMQPKITVVCEFATDDIGTAALLSGLALPGIPGVGKEPAAAGGGGGSDDDEAGSGSSGGLPLSQCFDLFSTPETLSPEDAW
jgi:hypothetical protein